MIQRDSSLSKLEFGDCQMEKVSKVEFFDSMIEKMSNSRDYTNQYVEKKQVQISNSVVDVDPNINLADLGSNYNTFDNCPALVQTPL